MNSDYNSKDNWKSENEYFGNNYKKSKARKSKNKYFVYLSIIIGINYCSCLLNIIQPADTRAPKAINVHPFNINNNIVSSGQCVAVNTPNNGQTFYKVHFVDGKAVALDMSQYKTLVFGEPSGVKNKDNKDNQENNGDNENKDNKENNENKENKDNQVNNENNKKIEKTRSSDTNKKTPFSDNFASPSVWNFTHLSVPEKRRNGNQPFNPGLPEAAQTSYPIVYNIKIKSDDEEDDDKEKEKEENE
jgi:hypothetical protein